MQPDRSLVDGASASGSVNEIRRVGETVRRPTGPWTPTVHHLLCHLVARGVPGVPRVHGIDAEGREILDYLPGEVAQRPWPAGLLADEGLLAVVDWLLAFHRAQADYVPPAAARWRVPDARWRPGLIVRHGDLGGWNTVWREGALVGVIDWDFALPGAPIEDLGQLLWHCVPLAPDATCRAAGLDPARRAARFSAACARAGRDEPAVRAAVLAVQEQERDWTRRFGATGLEPWRSFLARGDDATIAADQAWLRRQWAR